MLYKQGAIEETDPETVVSAAEASGPSAERLEAELNVLRARGNAVQVDIRLTPR